MGVINPGTMMLASAAVSAVGTLHNMKAQKAALSRENVRYERERKIAALDAIEQENIRKDMLNETLANRVPNVGDDNAPVYNWECRYCPYKGTECEGL